MVSLVADAEISRLAGHLWVFFGETPTELLGPQINWVIFRFNVELHELFVCDKY